MVAEPVDVKYCNDKNMEHLMRPYGSKAKIMAEEDKAPTLMAAMGTGGGNGVYIAEKLQYLTEDNVKTLMRAYGAKGKIFTEDQKTAAVLTQSGGGNGVYLAEPVGIAQRGRYINSGTRGQKCDGGTEQYYEARIDGKSNTLTTVQKDTLVAEPANYIVLEDGGLTPNLYEVKDGEITVKNKKYPIKLADGYYKIRKLTVRECMRLQTVPEWYEFPVSNSQAYKMLGNGWTVEVIAHLISGIFADIKEDK